ncbi:hypothetical protein ACMDCT_11605 [Halomonadaceae bacterium KBTZ08]
MNPIRRAGVIAFIDWLDRTHPEVRSLRDLSEDEFLSLATEYEGFKGLQIDKGHDVYRKWESTYYVFRRALSDGAALQELP